jgi:hypothetical protein
MPCHSQPERASRLLSQTEEQTINARTTLACCWTGSKVEISLKGQSFRLKLLPIEPLAS